MIHTRSLYHHRHHQTAHSAPRLGVTLSEVLISMLIMSIGIVSVATLFPISVLRSIQASQLTHAVLLRQNAEALIEYNSTVIHNPTRVLDASSNLRSENSALRADIDLNGNGNVTDSGDKDWNGDMNLDSGAYLIDPLGKLLANTPNQLGLLPRFTVKIRNPSTGVYNDPVSATEAELSCMLPDSWETVLESPVQSIDTTNFAVVLPSGQDWTNLSTAIVRNSNNPNNPRYRMVLIDNATGKSATVKDVFQIDPGNNSLIWQDPNAATTAGLPVWFPTTGSTRVRLEVQERRYTWMLTVRKNASGTAAVDVAAFFGRSFRPQDEFVYGNPSNANTSAAYSIDLQTGQATGNGEDGQPGIAGVDDDQDGTTDEADERGFPGSDDKRTITVTWATASDPAPFLKAGSYALDVTAGHWFRIVRYDLLDDPSNTPPRTIAKIVVDRDLATLPSNLTPQLVFFRGVIEVYPLGMRTAP